MQAAEYRKGFEQLRVRLIQYCNHKHPPGNGSIQFCNHQLPPTFGGLFKGSGVKKVEKFVKWVTSCLTSILQFWLILQTPFKRMGPSMAFELGLNCQP